MTILVFNSGSSSLKFKSYAVMADRSLALDASGSVSRIGGEAEGICHRAGRTIRERIGVRSYAGAAHWALKALQNAYASLHISAVGHRVVHGGDLFVEPTRLTPQTLTQLEELNFLAPLHNPPALEVIRACREALGDATPGVAVFDTAFHAKLPQAARSYALPESWTHTHAIHRYGFHGLAHRYMYERYGELEKNAGDRRRVVTLQLGNGCSACAINNGNSVETSMGYTPLEGLIMSTRSGDVDPGVIAKLSGVGITAEALDAGLNRESGLLALSGVSGDMQRLLEFETQGHDGARRAIAAFCHRVRKYIGAYFAVLGGADALLFGGGIGENAPTLRARICAEMEWAGLRLDAEANDSAIGQELCISARNSSVSVYVITVDEELLIARDTCSVAGIV